MVGDASSAAQSVLLCWVPCKDGSFGSICSAAGLPLGPVSAPVAAAVKFDDGIAAVSVNVCIGGSCVDELTSLGSCRTGS